MKEKLVITMNKIAKILSVVLSVSLVIGVTVAMLVSAFAVTAPKFSISVAEESKDSVKLALCLESGSINSCGVYVKAADWNNPNKTTGLTIKSVERGQAFRDFATAHENDKVPPLIAINTDRGFGEASFASVAAYSEKGVMLYFTFAKGNSAKAKIEPSDIIVEFDGTVDGNNNPVTPTLDNKIPAPATKSDDVVTPTLDNKIPAPATKSDDVVTTAPAADTTTAASSSDVVNPETGDRLTASAAVVALLAISGAAVVALRKKED